MIVYAICIPLAIFVGYFLTSNAYQTVYLAAALTGLLVLPLVLKLHYPILLFSWHASIALFFINSHPNLWLLMVLVSLGVSLVERILSRESHFISVPSVVLPMMIFLGVVFLTAEANGGFGLKALGSSVYGGKKYVYLLIGALSYFALVARQIPPEKVSRYFTIFVLGAVTVAIGDLFMVAPSWLDPLFLVFPPAAVSNDPFEFGVTRLNGTGVLGVAVFSWMIAKYGLRGIFLSGKVWRVVLLAAMFFVGTLGGFRTSLGTMMLIFAGAFIVEKIYQTWLVAPAILGSLLLALIIVPTAHHLPFTMQRAMAFLPLDLDRDALAAAESSTDWRINMWTGLLQDQVPQHFWKGKGFAFSKQDYDEMMGQTALASSGYAEANADEQGLALAGDYHNGMLSLIIPFGIWGVLTFTWFMSAGLRVVYLNLKYGRPEFRTINYFLFMMYFIEFGSYLSCFGGLSVSTDMAWFTGYLGMSIAINGGVCSRHSEQLRTQSVPEQSPGLIKPQFQPAINA